MRAPPCFSIASLWLRLNLDHFNGGTASFTESRYLSLLVITAGNDETREPELMMFVWTERPRRSRVAESNLIASFHDVVSTRRRRYWGLTYSACQDISPYGEVTRAHYGAVLVHLADRCRQHNTKRQRASREMMDSSEQRIATATRLGALQ